LTEEKKLERGRGSRKRKQAIHSKKKKGIDHECYERGGKEKRISPVRGIDLRKNL